MGLRRMRRVVGSAIQRESQVGPTVLLFGIQGVNCV